MWISAEHHNDHHLHDLSQPQQPENDYENINGQAVRESQPGVIYGVIERDPDSRQGDSKVERPNENKSHDDAVVYSDLQGTGAGSHIVAPSDQLYAKVRK